MMLETIFFMTFVAVVGLLVLGGLLIWKLRDTIAYLFEVLVYIPRALWTLGVQGAVALIGAVEDFLGDVEISDDPLLRGVVMGGFGLLAGLGVVVLLSMLLGQPWVLLALGGTVGLCMIVGLLADPERDWSLPAFPIFTKGGGPTLPLNL